MPIATDIAFALAVLAVLSTHLPSALRTFLLTLAVVDDLLAITIIAVFYTDDLSLGPLALALVPIGVVRAGRSARGAPVVAAGAAGRGNVGAGACQRRARHRRGRAAGLHGPRARATRDNPPPKSFEHRLRPVSAGFAVPVFAFFAAGVTVGGWSGLGASLLHPVTVGVLAGLVLGKPIGVFGTTFLLAKFTRASLDDDLAWRDVLGVALLAGIGFTVSLLIGELAFGHGTARGRRRQDRCAVGSVVAGLLAAVVLLSRNAAYRRIHAIETLDADHDGVPDIYEARQD